MSPWPCTKKPGSVRCPSATFGSQVEHATCRHLARSGPKHGRMDRNSAILLRTHRQARISPCSLRAPVGHTCVSWRHRVGRGGSINMCRQTNLRCALRSETPNAIWLVMLRYPVPSTQLPIVRCPPPRPILSASAASPWAIDRRSGGYATQVTRSSWAHTLATPIRWREVGIAPGHCQRCGRRSGRRDTGNDSPWPSAPWPFGCWPRPSRACCRA